MAAILTDHLPMAFWDSPFLGPGLALAGALLGGALIIALVRRWGRDADTPVAEASEQFSHYRALYERGALSEEEYHRLRRALRGGLTGNAESSPAPGVKETGPAPPPSSPPPETEPPAQTGIRPT